jgi:hypothetical protein
LSKKTKGRKKQGEQGKEERTMVHDVKGRNSDEISDGGIVL